MRREEGKGKDEEEKTRDVSNFPLVVGGEEEHDIVGRRKFGLVKKFGEFPDEFESNPEAGILVDEEKRDES